MRKKRKKRSLQKQLRSHLLQKGERRDDPGPGIVVDDGHTAVDAGLKGTKETLLAAMHRVLCAVMTRGAILQMCRSQRIRLAKQRTRMNQRTPKAARESTREASLFGFARSVSPKLGHSKQLWSNTNT